MAQQYDEQLELADVYAAALFALATEADTVDEIHQELESLVELEDSDEPFRKFMNSTSVDDDDRARSLEKIFRGRLSDMVLNTLLVMNAHERAALVPQLARAYVLRMEDARGQIEVTATTAVELDEQQRGEVMKVAETLSGRKPLVDYVVDPELLGGLVLQIGDMRYDDSIRRHLDLAEDQLRERANRGLQIGSDG